MQTFPLKGREIRLEQKLRHADDAVHGRANFVAHRGEKFALGAICLFGGFLRLHEFGFDLFQAGHVAAGADHPDLHDPIGVDLDQSLYALDSTTIDLCLSLFPWAKFRKHKAAVKMHTLLDLHGNIPTFIRITDGKVHDVNILDEFLPEVGAFYVMDRGYIDFERLFVFTLCSAFFVVRTKENILLQRRYSHPVDKTTGVRSDHTVILTSFESASVYPDAFRRVTYLDVETKKRFKFLTNNFTLPAHVIAQIYKSRWAVELFFKWIKQHLRIKAFYGTSENAVKTQIWIAVSIYVLVAILRKRLGLEASLYQTLQILSVTLFEKTPILQALQTFDIDDNLLQDANQLILFNL